MTKIRDLFRTFIEPPKQACRSFAPVLKR
jgi:hypothetical protein